MENKYFIMQEKIKTMLKDGYCPSCGSKNDDLQTKVCFNCEKSTTPEKPDYVRYLDEVAQLKELMSLYEWEVS